MWNYRANTFGPQTLAWFWTQRSHEVVKLSTKDMPRIKPEIGYVPAQDRYAFLPRINPAVNA
ncbi:hypothetical protein [Pseudomonas chlororaphis]|uniref:hypothetical protein n=1 Tax=Pseudomonas chlororaphis TaxID=587753 RepID=UPI001F1569D8|nr:hypothetical protein [Pseudomonas chlororaphis]